MSVFSRIRLSAVMALFLVSPGLLDAHPIVEADIFKCLGACAVANGACLATLGAGDFCSGMLLGCLDACFALVP